MVAGPPEPVPVTGYARDVGGTGLRGTVVALALLLGVVAMTTAGSARSTAARSSSTAAAPAHAGADAAVLVAELDRPADRGTSRRSSGPPWMLAVLVLALDAAGATLRRRGSWAAALAPRSRPQSGGIPQRAPPFLLLPLS